MKTIELTQERYDELLHKEALLEVIERFYAKTTDYSFRDVVGYLFAELKDEKA